MALAERGAGLDGPRVADAPLGGSFSCEVAASDADGDPLTLTYAWAQVGAAGEPVGALTATGPTLLNDLVSPGDGVTCTVTAADGFTTTRATSAVAHRADQPVVSANDAPRLTSSADAEGRAPNAGDALYCELVGAVDPDGWPAAGQPVLHYRTVDDAVVAEEDVASALDAGRPLRQGRRRRLRRLRPGRRRHAARGLR
ncbi:MAG: hypothetical protein U1F43_31415 [Myxococcota bacterium]